MNTKRFGSIGEAKALTWFVENGIPVSIPFGDNEKYDLVIEIHGKLLKVQVKSSAQVAFGRLVFNLRSVRYNNKGSHIYTKSEIDLFVLYHEHTNQLYCITPEECAGTAIMLRLPGDLKNLQTNCKFAENYLIDRIWRISPLSDTQ